MYLLSAEKPGMNRSEVPARACTCACSCACTHVFLRACNLYYVLPFSLSFLFFLDPHLFFPLLSFSLSSPSLPSIHFLR